MPRIPKRFLHMGSFALFEVGFIGRVVGVHVTFDFNVSLDGCAIGMPQPDRAGLCMVIPRFAEEGPVPTTTWREVFLFVPACVFVWVSSSCPSPQTREDFVIHAAKRVFDSPGAFDKTGRNRITSCRQSRSWPVRQRGVTTWSAADGVRVPPTLRIVVVWRLLRYDRSLRQAGCGT
jgi:hypothetical protein